MSLALLLALQSQGAASAPPVYQAIAAGSSSTCGLTTDGTVLCWGSNDYGQLGGANAPRSAVPVTIASPLRFHQLSAGQVHACALTEEGQAFCWGDDRGGQLAAPSSDRCAHRARCAKRPIAAAGKLRFRQLAASAFSTCGLAADGLTYCWGRNQFGQLGDGTTKDRRKPTLVAGAPAFERLIGSAAGVCGVTAEGVTLCWGYEAAAPVGGQPGYAPTPLSLGANLAGVHPGACGLSSSGVATCTFMRASSDFSQGVTSARVTGPIDRLLADLATGMGPIFCGLTGDGAAYCWGPRSYEDLVAGKGFAAVAVSESRRFRTLTLGFEHACGITPAGAAYCWGSNSEGQLGDGTDAARADAPVAVVPPN